MQPKYEVPLIPPNLRKEETIIQIAEALNYLTDVSNHIFTKITNKIDSNNAHIANITGRIDTANLKLKKLAGAKKATQVFSSSKYPAADNNRRYMSIFTEDNDMPPFRKYPIKYKSMQVKDEPLEILQFYHVKIFKKKPEAVNGLGKIPDDIDMVNDLLLYNSGKNPYNKYVFSDNLQVTQTAKKESTESDITDIGAAPLSISDKNLSVKNVGESYFYAPDLGNVPAIDVPLDLPDLPGIADDLRYIIEEDIGIAPSVTTTPNVPDLPEIITEVFPEIKELPEVKVSPEIQEIKNIKQVIIKEETKITKEDPLVIQEEIKPERVQVQKETKKPVEITDARANLMEAIRNAGGLKKLKVTETIAPKKPASGGDLMADLHAKLSMRRKGISGTKKEGLAVDAQSTMSTLSAMIPPPPVGNSKIEAAEEDDWED